MREYETVIVLDPALDDARVEQEIEAVSSVINQGGGEVIEVQRWGRRRMAYEVRKKREGNYSLIRFKSEREVLAELKRRFSLSESLLRYQTVHSMGPSAPPSSEGFSHHDRRGDSYGDRREGRGHGRDRFGDRGAAEGPRSTEVRPAVEKSAAPATEVRPAVEKSAAPAPEVVPHPAGEMAPSGKEAAPASEAAPDSASAASAPGEEKTSSES